VTQGLGYKVVRVIYRLGVLVNCSVLVEHQVQVLFPSSAPQKVKAKKNVEIIS
jgi:hypothetical protein